MQNRYKTAAAACAAILAATTITAGAVSPAPVTARPSGHAVYVDGQQENVAAYLINGNNYFKLRDIASILSGTDAQFEVVWDGDNMAVRITDGQPYTPVGGEQGLIGSESKQANVSSHTVYLDNQKMNYDVYAIEGNNYFKLRDIAEDLDFGVTWDGENQRVLIDTGAEYVPEGETPVEEPEEPEQETPVEEPEQPSSGLEGDTNGSGVIEPWEITGPEVGTYSEEYEAYLQSCGEEIVTVTVNYKVIDGATTKVFTNCDFPAVVWPAGPYGYMNNNDSPFDESYGAYTFQVEKDGTGSFDFRMPKSLYEKTLEGNSYFGIRCGLDKTNTYVYVDGDRYKSMTGQIEDRNLNENHIPVMMMIQYSRDPLA